MFNYVVSKYIPLSDLMSSAIKPRLHSLCIVHVFLKSTGGVQGVGSKDLIILCIMMPFIRLSHSQKSMVGGGSCQKVKSPEGYLGV